jgi:hypothetical protein
MLEGNKNEEKPQALRPGARVSWTPLHEGVGAVGWTLPLESADHGPSKVSCYSGWKRRVES